jgi:protein O-mannosyl-transferase
MPSQRRTLILNILLLTVLILITFLPCVWNGFTAWDDKGYLTDNPFIKTLSAANLIKAFSSLTLGSYMPLPLLTYALEFNAAQLHPFLYHLDNILLHTAAAVLAYLLILRLDGRAGIALATALLFAVNPMRVESVAWISGRKDLLCANLLCAIFYLSALLMHIRMITSPKKRYFWGTLVLFICALFSKTQALSLPFALLVLDYFFNSKITRQDIIFKIPLFILSAVFSGVSLYGLSGSFPGTSTPAFGFIDRLLLTNMAFFLHIVQGLLPYKTSFFYPYPEKSGAFFPLYVYLAVAANAVIIYIVGTMVRKNKFAWLAASMFVIMLVSPLWSIWHEGYFISERDMYLPGIWLSYGVVRIAAEMKPTEAVYKVTAAAILTVFFSLLSFGKCFIWKNDLSVWGNVIDAFPQSPAGYIFRGEKLHEYGLLEPALKDFNAAIALKTQNMETYYNRAMIYTNFSEWRLAIADFDTILAIDPLNMSARFHRALCYKKIKDYDSALRDLNILAENPETNNPAIEEELKTLMDTKS